MNSGMDCGSDLMMIDSAKNSGVDSGMDSSVEYLL